MRIKCPKCGVTTSFVIDGEIIRRDFKVHGNRAESLSCFNCNVPLQMPVTVAPKPEPDRCEAVKSTDHSTLAVDTTETKTEIPKKRKKYIRRTKHG